MPPGRCTVQYKYIFSRDLNVFSDDSVSVISVGKLPAQRGRKHDFRKQFWRDEREADEVYAKWIWVPLILLTVGFGVC